MLRPSLTFITEEHRKDFYVMLSHHVVTVLVISGAYSLGMLNLGIIILGLHDAADVLLYATKCLHYSKMPENLTPFFFIWFAATFFVTRLIFYPLSLYVHYMYMPFPIATQILMYPLTVSLYFMHVYWFYLIVKV